MLGLSRIAFIQDYDDQKKQYHNLEKDYVVHGKPRLIRIPDGEHDRRQISDTPADAIHIYPFV